MNDYPNQEYYSPCHSSDNQNVAGNNAMPGHLSDNRNASGNNAVPGHPSDNRNAVENVSPFGNVTAHPGISNTAPIDANPTQTPQAWAFTPAAPVTPQSGGLSEEEKGERIRHFRLFSITSVIYALFYTFCLYKNASGITYPFFTGGTLFCFFLSLKKLGISAKKDSVFYVIAILLLGISTFCTDAGNIISMNKAGIFVLFFVLMIHNFYGDSQWNFSKYMKSIFQTIFGSIGVIGRPISDFSLFMKARKEEKEAKKPYGQYIFIGILISIPLLFVVMMLLCSADMVFASIIDDIFATLQIPQNFFSICGTVLFSFFASYCIIAYLMKKTIKEEVIDKRTGEPVLAITVTSILSAIYLLFCAVQIIYLFTGSMELPVGYSYAAYAREGFFQLLFICFLNLCIVLICLGRFKKHKVLKAIMAIISLCTYIMIASSALRMLMYIKSYDLTFLRIFVLWSLAVIFFLMSGVLINIYKEKFPLFKYSMVVVTVFYIVLSFSRPDYFIAKYNISQMLSDQDSYHDTIYLTYYLSADAAPAILDEETLPQLINALPDKKKGSENNQISSQVVADSWIGEYAKRISLHNESIEIKGTKARTFNLSRFIADKYITQFWKRRNT
ncbi:DUF4173 domain-containing protein [Lachnospiraceae bacterium]|nr:DUF4173 domain-containing protein [Lachnospiraceae bacterium]